jgi:hypothetical protein
MKWGYMQEEFSINVTLHVSDSVINQEYCQNGNNNHPLIILKPLYCGGTPLTVFSLTARLCSLDNNEYTS